MLGTPLWSALFLLPMAIVRVQLEAAFKRLEKAQSQVSSAVGQVPNRVAAAGRDAQAAALKDLEASVPPALAAKVGDAVAAAVQSSFAAAVVPAFERAMQSMFSQVSLLRTR